MKYKWFVVLLVIFLAISVAVGCAPRQRILPPQPTPNQTPDMSPQRAPQMVPGEDRARAKAIANIVEKIEGVRSATVIVNNNTAYVGLDLDKNVEGSTTNRIKKEVVTRVKNADLSTTRVNAYRTITTVYVTADMDTVTRLKNYSKDIQRGKPLSGMVDEIEELFRRPAPTS